MSAPKLMASDRDPVTCTHERHPDEPASLPCPWPECWPVSVIKFSGVEWARWHIKRVDTDRETYRWKKTK